MEREDNLKKEIENPQPPTNVVSLLDRNGDPLNLDRLQLAEKLGKIQRKCEELEDMVAWLNKEKRVLIDRVELAEEKSDRISRANLKMTNEKNNSISELENKIMESERLTEFFREKCMCLDTKIAKMDQELEHLKQRKSESDQVVEELKLANKTIEELKREKMESDKKAKLLESMLGNRLSDRNSPQPRAKEDDISHTVKNSPGSHSGHNPPPPGSNKYDNNSPEAWIREGDIAHTVKKSPCPQTAHNPPQPGSDECKAAGDIIEILDSDDEEKPTGAAESSKRVPSSDEINDLVQRRKRNRTESMENLFTCSTKMKKEGCAVDEDAVLIHEKGNKVLKSSHDNVDCSPSERCVEESQNHLNDRVSSDSEDESLSDSRMEDFVASLRSMAAGDRGNSPQPWTREDDISHTVKNLPGSHSGHNPPPPGSNECMDSESLKLALYSWQSHMLNDVNITVGGREFRRERMSDNEHEENQLAPIQPPVGFEWRRPNFIHKTKALNLYDRHEILKHVEKVLKKVGGPKALSTFSSSCFGHLLKVCKGERSNAPLHHLLAREIVGPTIPILEHWFFIGGQIARFRAQEYSLITGLMFGQNDFDPSADHIIPENGIYRRHFGRRGVKVRELHEKFNAFDLGSDVGDYIKAANLLIFYLFLLCRGDIYIEDWAWTLVEDLDGWEWFPWGSYSFQVMSHYISIAAMKPGQVEKKAYHVYGPFWAFQLWAYEAIPSLGRACSNRDEDVSFPRCLMWRSRATKLDFSKLDFADFFEDEELEVHQTLEPIEEEEFLIYFQSLWYGDTYDVSYKPPPRIGHHTALSQASAHVKKKKMFEKKTGVDSRTSRRTRDEITPNSSVERRTSQRPRHFSPVPEMVNDEHLDQQIDRRIDKVLFDKSETGFIACITRNVTDSMVAQMKSFFRHK